ncbi:MAG: hypothetical protein EXS05_17420 [Planctomycetaceae bacterium]|nr:hypothetical protein [Planctomycetaceae bacterium]
MRGVLADLGVNWVEFEYNLPGDSVAIFKFVARDEAGKIIPELSKLHEFSPLNGDNFGKVRLTRINPEPLTVGKPAKKVRWAKTVANTGPGLTEWLPEHYGGTRSLTSWMEGTSIDSPEHDREYVLWHVLTYAKGLTTIFENSPTAFRYEIRFTLRKLKDGERPGTHRFMDVKDEP